MAKFNLLVGQALSRIALRERTMKGVEKQAALRKASWVWHCPEKAPVSCSGTGLRVCQDFLPFLGHSPYFSTTSLCQHNPSNQTVILISTCPNLAILSRSNLKCVLTHDAFFPLPCALSAGNESPLLLWISIACGSSHVPPMINRPATWFMAPYKMKTQGPCSTIVKNFKLAAAEHYTGTTAQDTFHVITLGRFRGN